MTGGMNTGHRMGMQIHNSHLDVDRNFCLLSRFLGAPLFSISGKEKGKSKEIVI